MAPVTIIVALLIFLSFPNVAKAQVSNDPNLAASVGRLYENLQKKDFGAVWNMLTADASRGTTQVRYVDHLRKSNENLNLVAYKTIRLTTFKIPGNYSEATTELSFEFPGGQHQSTHFTLWLLENGSWRLDEERTLEPGQQISDLPAWKLRQTTPEMSLPVGITQQILPIGSGETLRLGDEVKGNPVLRIGLEAGIFRRNGINLQIQDLSPDMRVSLSELFSSSDITAAKLSYNNVHQPIPSNIRLVSGFTAISAPIFVRSKSVTKLGDLSGKTIGLFGFSSSQVELMSKSLQVELQPRPSNLKIVNSRGLTADQISKTLESEKTDAFLLHPTVARFFTGKGYQTLGMIQIQSAGIFMPQQFITRYTDLALRFLKAQFESVAYYRTHKEASMLTMTQIWPGSDIRFIEALYERYFAELPTRTNDWYPKADDVKLSLQETTFDDLVKLGKISEPRLVQALQQKGSIPLIAER